MADQMDKQVVLPVWLITIILATGLSVSGYFFTSIQSAVEDVRLAVAQMSGAMGTAVYRVEALEKRVEKLEDQAK